MNQKQLNQTCAEYLKKILEVGIKQIQPPESLQIESIELSQPLAENSAQVRISIRNKKNRYVNELYLTVDLS